MLLFLVDAERAAVHDAPGPGGVELRHRVAVAGADRDRVEAAQVQVGVDPVVGRVVAVTDDQDTVAHTRCILSDETCGLTLMGKSLT